MGSPPARAIPPIDVGESSISQTRSHQAGEILPAARGDDRRGDHEDTLLERNIVYDRLMTGQETETGELPPTYGEALASAERAGSATRMGRSRSDQLEEGEREGRESRSRSRLRQSVAA